MSCLEKKSLGANGDIMSIEIDLGEGTPEDILRARLMYEAEITILQARLRNLQNICQHANITRTDTKTPYVFFTRCHDCGVSWKN